MARMEVPTTPGDYNIDGVSIIVLPNKIIIDTGGRQQNPRVQGNQSAYAGKKKEKERGENKKKSGGSVFNDILDNAQDLVMGTGRYKH